MKALLIHGHGADVFEAEVRPLDADGRVEDRALLIIGSDPFGQLAAEARFAQSMGLSCVLDLTDVEYEIVAEAVPSTMPEHPSNLLTGKTVNELDRLGPIQ